MRRVTLAVLFLFTTSIAIFAQQLSVYVIDVEGGKATLIVTPQKESMLVDTGWPYDSQDADRIASAAKDAGVNKIDYLLVTHYHIDHVGGVPWLLQRIPVAHVVDHGPSVEHDTSAELLYASYERATAKIPHIVVKPGDTLPIKGAEIRIVSAAGALLNAAATEPENPLCRDAAARAPENDENDQSIGFLLRFGQFRMVDLADLTAGKERNLFCPANAMGRVDVLMVSHHGLDRSNSPLMIGSLQPRVAIMNNGATKGGSPTVVKDLSSAKGFEGLWLLHAVSGGNTPPKFVANPEASCRGYGIKLTATSDGAFAVMNQRTGESVTYASR